VTWLVIRALHTAAMARASEQAGRCEVVAERSRPAFMAEALERYEAENRAGN